MQHFPRSDENLHFGVNEHSSVCVVLDRDIANLTVPARHSNSPPQLCRAETAATKKAPVVPLTDGDTVKTVAVYHTNEEAPTSH